MGEKTQNALNLHFDGRLRLEFQGARITSDAGLLACRELDDALRLTEMAPTYLQETRGGRNVQHELVPLLRQSVYTRLAGYEAPMMRCDWPGTLPCRRWLVTGPWRSRQPVPIP